MINLGSLEQHIAFRVREKLKEIRSQTTLYITVCVEHKRDCGVRSERSHFKKFGDGITFLGVEKCGCL